MSMTWTLDKQGLGPKESSVDSILSFFIYGSDDDNGCNDHDHDKDDYKDGEDNLRSSEGEDDVGKISRKRSVEKVSNL